MGGTAWWGVGILASVLPVFLSLFFLDSKRAAAWVFLLGTVLLLLVMVFLLAPGPLLSGTGARLFLVCLLTLVAFLSLCFYVPAMASRFPRVAAAAWWGYPLAALALLGAFLFLLALSVATSWFWSHQARLWEALRERPMLRGRIDSFDWLWPWFPVVLVYGSILWAAARFLTRGVFHGVVAAILGCAVLGVTLHAEPPATPGAVLQSPCPFTQPYICAMYCGESLPCGTFSPPPPPYAFSPPQKPPSSSEVVRMRWGTRVVGPALHQPASRTDLLSLGSLGLGLLLAYRALDSLNARRASLQVEIGPIYEGNPDAKAKADARDTQVASAEKEDADGAGGARVRRVDLERYMREHVRRNAPHSPSRVPGGRLVYWAELLDRSPGNGNLSWAMRAVTLVMRAFVQPSGLRLTGAVITDERGRKRLQVEVKNLRTQNIELTREYKKRSLWRSARLAAYAASQTALELSPGLPEWLYWREQSGEAIEAYWKGRDAFKDPPFRVIKFDTHKLQDACAWFRIAAKNSHGNGLARLQYGQAHEALARDARAAQIYLDLLERHPRLLAARYRLALVCSYVDRWAEPHLREPWPTTRGPSDCPNTGGQRLFNELVQLLRSLETSEVLTGAERKEARELLDTCTKDELVDTSTSLRCFCLRLAERQFRCLQSLVSWSVVGWYLTDVRYRRRKVAMAMLWPPRQLRAFRHSIRVSLACVCLRRCLLEERKAAEVQLTEEAKPRGLKDSREVHRLVKRMDGIAREACSCHRRTVDWGTVHYNLACFYALCMTPGLDNAALGYERIPEPDALRVDFWARRAIHHLVRSMRDPDGPISKGSWWWLERDPDLRALRRHPRYWRWKEWVNLPDKRTAAVTLGDEFPWVSSSPEESPSAVQ